MVILLSSATSDVLVANAVFDEHDDDAKLPISAFLSQLSKPFQLEQLDENFLYSSKDFVELKDAGDKK